MLSCDTLWYRITTRVKVNQLHATLPWLESRLLPHRKRARPAAVLFNDVVDFGHEADGFGEGDDKFVVVGNVVGGELATGIAFFGPRSLSHFSQT